MFCHTRLLLRVTFLEFILFCPVRLSSGHVLLTVVSSLPEAEECLLFHGCLVPQQQHAHGAAPSKTDKLLLIFMGMWPDWKDWSLLESCTAELYISGLTAFLILNMISEMRKAIAMSASQALQVLFYFIFIFISWNLPVNWKGQLVDGAERGRGIAPRQC